MQRSFDDMPVVVDTPGVKIRQDDWGDFTVALEDFAAGTDTEPVFKGLPNDRCQCLHWGYVLQGKVRIRYADRVDVISAGQAYYLEPGHLPIFDEDTRLVEFSPKGEYAKTLEVAGANMAALIAAAGGH